jgi:hypothetical protein
VRDMLGGGTGSRGRGRGVEKAQDNGVQGVRGGDQGGGR